MCLFCSTCRLPKLVGVLAMWQAAEMGGTCPSPLLLPLGGYTCALDHSCHVWGNGRVGGPVINQAHGETGLMYPPAPNLQSHLPSPSPDLSYVSSLPEISFSLDFKSSPFSLWLFCFGCSQLSPFLSLAAPHLLASLAVSHGEHQTVEVCGATFPSDCSGF